MLTVVLRKTTDSPTRSMNLTPAKSITIVMRCVCFGCSTCTKVEIPKILRIRSYATRQDKKAVLDFMT